MSVTPAHGMAAERLHPGGQLGLENRFQASLAYTVRTFSNKDKSNYIQCRATQKDENGVEHSGAGESG